MAVQATSAKFALLSSIAVLALGCGARSELGDAGSGSNATSAGTGGSPPAEHLCGDAAWSLSLPSVSPIAIASDTDGGIFVGGCFVGDLDLGTGVVLHTASSSHFLARFGPDGAPTFAQSFGDLCTDRQTVVASNAKGAAVLVAVFDGTATLGATTLDAGPTRSLLVARLANGVVDGAAFPFIQPGGTAIGLAAALSDGGEIAIAPDVDVPLMFDGHESGVGDATIVSLGPDFSLRYLRRYDGNFPDAIEGLAFASDGTLILGGWFDDKVDFDGEKLVAKNVGQDGFILALDEGGHRRFLTQVGGHDNDAVHAVAPSPDGTIWIAGSFIDTITLGPDVLTGNGTNDQFIARLDAKGAVTFGARLIDAPYGTTTSIVATTTGGAVAAGAFFSHNALDGIPLSAGKFSDDAWLAAFAPSGTASWACSYGGRDGDYATALARGGDGSVALAGTFARKIDFGAGALHAQGGDGTSFVARFLP